MNEALSKTCRDVNCRRKGELLDLDDFYPSKMGFMGRRATCKECHKKRYGPTMQRASQKRKIRKGSLPDTLTSSEAENVCAYFDSCCALTRKEEDLQLDHFIPLAWGVHALEYEIGGTTYANMLPLNQKVNIAKGHLNPFEWIVTATKQFDIEMKVWEEVIKYIATKHELSVVQFQSKVNSCYSMVLVERSIELLEIRCGYKNPPYYLIDSFLEKGINIKLAVERFGNAAALTFINDEKTVKYLKEAKGSLTLKLNQNH